MSELVGNPKICFSAIHFIKEFLLPWNKGQISYTLKKKHYILVICLLNDSNSVSALIKKQWNQALSENGPSHRTSQEFYCLLNLGLTSHHQLRSVRDRTLVYSLI